MNNFDRNVRTLIVCFVMALVALVPLRFMEYGNYQPQVLGESESVVVLPNAEVSNCIVNEEADEKINELINQYVSSQIDKIEADIILQEIEEIELNKCQ